MSPTITHVSSRSPTPSPPEKNNLPRLHRHQSRSPQRPITSYKDLPKDADNRWSSGQDSSCSSSPTPAQEAPGAVDRSSTPKPYNHESITSIKMPQPLLQDISQYINPQISAITSMTTNTSLEELAHLVRLSTYQEKKRAHSRIRLQRSLVSTALSARLARCGELAHRTLVDNFRADEKKNFASLYNAIHDVRNSCDASRRFALLEPDFDNGRSSISGPEDTTPALNFMHEIPLRSRECLLNF